MTELVQSLNMLYALHLRIKRAILHLRYEIVFHLLKSQKNVMFLVQSRNKIIIK
jgi:hypothetical protein